MTIQEWGEDRYISYLAERFPSTSDILGIGDDCAVIPGKKEFSWLVTTDALVEGIHFRTEQIDPKSLGYKLIAVNVSDIVAKGGEPKYAFFTLALPKNSSTEWCKQLCHGIHRACKKYGVLLLGGDTNGSKRDLFLNVTLIGKVKKKNVKFRCTAKPGDILCTTGFLGNSAGGFKALEQKIDLEPSVNRLIQAHFCPEINILEGRWLGQQKSVHAMMDISDGLDCDLRRMLKASGSGARVEIESIPISRSLQQVCKKHQWDANELAITGGEDYCLLLTIASSDFERINRAFQRKFLRSLYAIGEIINSPNRMIYTKNGKKIRLKLNPFNHFS